MLACAAPTAPVHDGFEPADVQLLLDLALVAAGLADVASTDALADGLIALRPALEGPTLARGLARLNAGDADDAVRVLRAAPPSDAAARSLHDSVLGLALQLAGHPAESRRLLQAAATHPGAGIARAMLGLPINEVQP